MYLGFRNIEDFIAGVTFGTIKVKAVAMAGVLGSAFTAGGVFLSSWVIDDERVYIFLVAALLADWITGMIKGIRSPVGFVTAKALRIFPIIVTHLFIVAVINQTAGIIVATIAGGGITAITAISVIKNASVIGWIGGEVARYLERKIDTHKNTEKSNQNDDI